MTIIQIYNELLYSLSSANETRFFWLKRIHDQVTMHHLWWWMYGGRTSLGSSSLGTWPDGEIHQEWKKKRCVVFLLKEHRLREHQRRREGGDRRKDGVEDGGRSWGWFSAWRRDRGFLEQPRKMLPSRPCLDNSWSTKLLSLDRWKWKLKRILRSSV